MCGQTGHVQYDHYDVMRFAKLWSLIIYIKYLCLRVVLTVTVTYAITLHDELAADQLMHSTNCGDYFLAMLRSLTARD